MKRMTPEDLRQSIDMAHEQLARTKSTSPLYFNARSHLEELRKIERQWAENSAKDIIEDD